MCQREPVAEKDISPTTGTTTARIPHKCSAKVLKVFTARQTVKEAVWGKSPQGREEGNPSTRKHKK